MLGSDVRKVLETILPDQILLELQRTPPTDSSLRWLAGVSCWLRDAASHG